jgi:hypothetical protein
VDGREVTAAKVLAPRSVAGAVSAWWFAPAPTARVAWLRRIVYPFVFLDVLVTTSWVRAHGDVPAALHRPLAVGRLLDLPAPGPVLVPALLVGLLAAAAVATTGRWPRAAGAAVFVLYLWWMLVAFSYGKVDHDRFAYLVALAVLPTVGRASTRDRHDSEAAGWALRSIQVAVVATYFLSALAKLRYVGPEWVTSSVLLRSIARRGSALADPLTDHPGLLVALQALIVLLELASPLLLRTGRTQRIGVGVAAVFHLATFVGVRIIFLPHLVCLPAFLPLERLGWRGRRTAADHPPPTGVPGGVTPPP